MFVVRFLIELWTLRSSTCMVIYLRNKIGCKNIMSCSDWFGDRGVIKCGSIFKWVLAHFRNFFSIDCCIDFGIDLWWTRASILTSMGRHLAPSGSQVAPQICQVAPKWPPFLKIVATFFSTSFQDHHQALLGYIFDRFDIDSDTILVIWATPFEPKFANPRNYKTHHART